jgi:hypothetical protein
MLRWLQAFMFRTGWQWQGRLNDQIIVMLQPTNAIETNWSMTLMGMDNTQTTETLTGLDLDGAQITAKIALTKLGWPLS